MFQSNGVLLPRSQLYDRAATHGLCAGVDGLGHPPHVAVRRFGHKHTDARELLDANFANPLRLGEASPLVSQV
jgi:hypothetical protein